MDEVQQKIMHVIPQLCQRQDSVLDQLRDLIPVAFRLGSYDAGEFLRNFVESRDKEGVVNV